MILSSKVTASGDFPPSINNCVNCSMAASFSGSVLRIVFRTSSALSCSFFRR